MVGGVALCGGSYPFPSAKTCKYAPRSLVINGVVPLVHRGMLQGTECPLGACPFDPCLDLTTLSLQLAFLVDNLAEEVLCFGDGLSPGFHAFVS